MENIVAPYNFVHLSGWIFSPEWADQVSLDIPCTEGLSGFLDIQITAHTPLLIGHEQKPSTVNRPGEVHPFLSNGTYAIPGTSLKGAIRNVLEIVSFSKMRYVDDRRLGIRDITTLRVRQENYELTDQLAGYLCLRKDKSGIADIIPCDVAHVWHQDLSRYVTLKDQYPFKAGMSVRRKYNEWSTLDKWRKPESKDESSNRLPEISFDLGKGNTLPKVRNLGSGRIRGNIVFTGQISDRNKTPRGGKYRDFVFFNRRDSEPIEVRPKVLADFRFIHGDGDSQNNGPWNDYWRFFRNEDVAVFFQTKDKKADGEITSIGLAYMYKLAYPNSIGETIAHTHPLHRSDDYPDLAELLFGKVHPDPKKSEATLKSRLSFGLCRAEREPIKLHPTPATVLNGPKPTYFPNYTRQAISPRLAKDQSSDDYHYRTYNQEDSEVRGWKRYPVRPASQIQLTDPPPPDGKSKVNYKVQVNLYPLPEQTRFTGRIRFHNLRPEELGALLWVLTWGGNDQLRHSLGMGKAFGYGQVSIHFSGGEIRTNRNYDAPRQFDKAICQTYMTDFENLMNKAFVAAQKSADNAVSWRNSEQLTQLMAMANPRHRKATKENLRHMKLGRGTDNEFANAKKDGLVLPEYDETATRLDVDIFPRDYPVKQTLVNEIVDWVDKAIEAVMQKFA
ncbi:MAG: TIGR03986 family type III CRISPR-associated RAMP protein, partial [Methylococcales bacterium]